LDIFRGNKIYPNNNKGYSKLNNAVAGI